MPQFIASEWRSDGGNNDRLHMVKNSVVSYIEFGGVSTVLSNLVYKDARF